MIPFTFESPQTILFGANTRAKLPELIQPYGEKLFILTGTHSLAKTGWLTKFQGLLKDFQCHFYACPPGEPTVASLNYLLKEVRSWRPDLILGLGGGTVLDSAKAVAGLLDKEGDVEDYMEGIGHKIITGRSVPWFALPTTAGTGTEVTKNAVIKAVPKGDDYGYKKSIRSAQLLATTVIIDPELMLHLPRYQTATSGLDALTQLIEAYVSIKAKPLPDALIRDALPGMLKALRTLTGEQLSPETELQARSDAAYGALVSGWALANAGLGAAHGFASGLGGMYEIPHGLICASFLNPVLEFNKPAIEDKIRELLLICYEQKKFKPVYNDFLHEPVKALQTEVSELLKLFKLENALKQYKINQSMIPEIARRSAGSSMSGNPVEMTQSQKEQMLTQVLV